MGAWFGGNTILWLTDVPYDLLENWMAPTQYNCQ